MIELKDRWETKLSLLRHGILIPVFCYMWKAKMAYVGNEVGTYFFKVKLYHESNIQK